MEVTRLRSQTSLGIRMNPGLYAQLVKTTSCRFVFSVIFMLNDFLSFFIYVCIKKKYVFVCVG